MTKEDLEVMFENTKKIVLSEINKTEKLVKKGILETSEFNLRYLKHNEDTHYLSEGDLDDIMFELQKKKEKFSGNYIGLSQELVLNGVNYDGDHPEMIIRTNWYSNVELSEEQIKKFVETDVKKELEVLVFERAKKLGSEKIYKMGIDCKMLTLFKSGKIDFDTLSVLTYSDCKI